MPISEAKKRNNANYTAKCDYINIRPLKPEGQRSEPPPKMPGKVCKDIFCRQSGNAWSATACPSTSPPPMKKNKTDQHKSPCKLTACKGFFFFPLFTTPPASRPPTTSSTGQQLTSQHHHRHTSTSPNTDSQHTAHTQTHNTRRNTSGQHRRPAGRRADDHQRNARPRRLRSY